MRNAIIEQTTACINDFKAGCNDCEMEKFIDLFLTRYASDCRDHTKLKIQVVKGDHQSFIPLLAVSIEDFKTVFGCSLGHPCLTIRSGNTHTIQSLDLAFINNMHIETIDSPGCPWTCHNITFNYKNIVDYDMSLLLYH